MTKAEASVSLGLIVTELVINALKHAFPRHRKGKICVDYRSDGRAWTLSVRDTGIGMPEDAADAKPGLGTGIVEALARQLGATVEVAAVEAGDDGLHRPCLRRWRAAGRVARKRPVLL